MSTAAALTPNERLARALHIPPEFTTDAAIRKAGGKDAVAMIRDLRAGKDSAERAAAYKVVKVLKATASGYSVTSGGLFHIRADEVEIVPLKWAWHERIPIGKYTLIAGEQCVGKSLTTCSIAAIVTTGDEWPDGTGKAEKGDVVILSAEDDPGDTLVPRLKAAGADLERVRIIKSMMKPKAGEQSRVFDLALDLKQLAEAAATMPNVKLFIIDPISAYLGTKVDSYKNTEVRATLTPLAEWAAKHDAAILAISHFNKGGTGNALSRIIDSQAFTAAARSTWIMVREQKPSGDGPTGRVLMISPKNTNAPADLPGMVYRIKGHEFTHKGKTIKTVRIVWDGTTKVTADEAMQKVAKPREAPARDAAQIWLLDRLKAGPVPRATIEEDARGNGHSMRTVQDAKAVLGVISEKEGFGAEGPWVWRLPDDDGDAF